MATSMLYNRVNINGIPCIQTTSLTETSTSLTYNFAPTMVISPRFSGLIAVRITETPETDTLPVSFNVPSIAGSLIALTGLDGTEVTGAELTEAVHLVFYDRYNGVLQLIA